MVIDVANKNITIDEFFKFNKKDNKEKQEDYSGEYTKIDITSPSGIF